MNVGLTEEDSLTTTDTTADPSGRPYLAFIGDGGGGAPGAALEPHFHQQSRLHEADAMYKESRTASVIQDYYEPHINNRHAHVVLLM